MLRKRLLTVLGQSSVIINGHVIPYTIKRSPRIRCVRIVLSPQSDVTVVVPRVFDVSQIPHILSKRGKWILSKLAECRQFKSLTTIKGDNKIPYLGRELKLVVLRNQRTDYVKLSADELVVGLKSLKDGNIAAMLQQWFRWQCSQFITTKVEEISARLGINYNHLAIRGQRTRWASCSHRGNLNFNWKLMTTPEPVIEYVIVHELIHVKEMNHSRRFWELVEKYCPDYRQHRKWLKEHEIQLNARWFSLEEQFS